MDDALVPIPRPHFTIPAAIAHVDLVDAFLSGRNPRTMKAYAFDLGDFAAWAGVETAGRAVEQLLAGGQGEANRVVFQYRRHLESRDLASATIGRRLAAIRSVVKLGRLLGRINWTIDVESPTVEPRRDSRGPDEAEWLELWRAAKEAGASPKAKRDRALLSLLYDLALRRAEAIGIDMAHVNLGEGTISIRGKGRSELERLTLPGPTRRFLVEWLDARGPGDGPVFVRLDPGAVGHGRLTGDSVNRIVQALGRRAGLPRRCRSHGLRHSSITASLDKGRDIRDVRKYSRHRTLEMLLRYDDSRRDTAGDIAKLIAGDRE